MSADTGRRFVLVRGVVYELRGTLVRHRVQYKWYRASIPSEPIKPGKRCPWPAAYAEDKLPEHEILTEDQAQEIKRDSRKYLSGGAA